MAALAAVSVIWETVYHISRKKARRRTRKRKIGKNRNKNQPNGAKKSSDRKICAIREGVEIQGRNLCKINITITRTDVATVCETGEKGMMGV